MNASFALIEDDDQETQITTQLPTQPTATATTSATSTSISTEHFLWSEEEENDMSASALWKRVQSARSKYFQKSAKNNDSSSKNKAYDKLTTELNEKSDGKNDDDVNCHVTLEELDDDDENFVDDLTNSSSSSNIKSSKKTTKKSVVLTIRKKTKNSSSPCGEGSTSGDGAIDDENDVTDSPQEAQLTVSTMSKQNDDDDGSQMFEECWICKISLHGVAVSEREKHINHCLDQHASEEYIKNHFSRNKIRLVGSSSSKRNSSSSTSSSKVKKSKKRSRTSDENEEKEEEICEYMCLICRKDLTADTARNRMKHLKACSKLHHVSVNDIKQLQSTKTHKKRKIRKQEEQCSDNNISDAEKKTTTDELNTSNIFEPFKYGADERLRGKLSDSSEITTVSEWLNSLNLSQYCDKLVNNGFDTLEICSILETSDLVDMEITKPGHRKQILAAAKNLKKTLLFRAKMQQNEEKKKARRAKAASTIEVEPVQTNLVPVVESEANDTVTCDPISNTQVSLQIMADIRENDLVSHNAVEVSKPLTASRFAKAGKKDSLWSLSKPTMDITEDVFFTQKNPTPTEQNIPHSPVTTTATSGTIHPDLYESPNVKETTPARPFSETFTSPIIIDDTPGFEHSKTLETEPKRSRRSSFDSLLDEPLMPGIQLFRNDVAHTQPRSPVLLDSDDESSEEVECLPATITQVSTQVNMDNESLAVSTVESLNTIQEAYIQRCKKDIEMFRTNIFKMYDDMKFCIDEHTKECQADVNNHISRISQDYSFQPFILPSLLEICGHTVIEPPPRSTDQVESSEKQKSPLTKSPSSRPRRKSPKNRKSPRKTRQPVYQAPKTAVLSDTDAGTTSESDFNTYSDSEVRTVDWSQQKKQTARRNERIARTVLATANNTTNTNNNTNNSGSNSQSSANPTNSNLSMPNFSSMKAEELKAYLSRFGVKPGAKAFMIQMCTKIYQSQSS